MTSLPLALDLERTWGRKYATVEWCRGYMHTHGLQKEAQTIHSTSSGGASEVIADWHSFVTSQLHNTAQYVGLDAVQRAHAVIAETWEQLSGNHSPWELPQVYTGSM